MVTKIFQLLLLIAPIAISADINMDIFDLIFFRTSVIILFMASLFDNQRRQIPDYVKKIIMGLLGLCLFNMFNHSFGSIVLANTMNTFLAVLAFLIIYIYYDETKNIKKFILGAALINLIFFIIQKIGYDPIFDKSNYGMIEGGFFGNAARLANYLTLIIPFIPYILIPLVVIFGLFVKQYVVFIPVFIILFVKFKLLKIRIIIIACILLLSFLLRNHFIESFRVRFQDAWFPVLQAFFDRPLIGCGLGINPVPGSNLGVILNSYIQFIIGVGIYGVIWFGYVFKMIYKEITLKRLTIPFITLILLMLVEYPIEMMRLWFLIIAIFVMQLLKSNREEFNLKNVRI